MNPGNEPQEGEGDSGPCPAWNYGQEYVRQTPHSFLVSLVQAGDANWNEPRRDALACAIGKKKARQWKEPRNWYPLKETTSWMV